MTTSATTVSAAPVTVISKYRVHLRDLAVGQGFKVTQTSTSTDLFSKGTTHISVTFGASQVTSAGLMEGKAIKAEAKGEAKGKLQTISTWVGVPMKPTQKWNLKAEVLEALQARAAKEIRVLEVAKA